MKRWEDGLSRFFLGGGGHRHVGARTAALPTGTLPRLVTFLLYFSDRKRVKRLVACTR